MISLWWQITDTWPIRQSWCLAWKRVWIILNTAMTRHNTNIWKCDQVTFYLSDWKWDAVCEILLKLMSGKYGVEGRTHLLSNCSCRWGWDEYIVTYINVAIQNATNFWQFKFIHVAETQMRPRHKWEQWNMCDNLLNIQCSMESARIGLVYNLKWSKSFLSFSGWFCCGFVLFYFHSPEVVWMHSYFRQILLDSVETAVSKYAWCCLL